MNNPHVVEPTGNRIWSAAWLITAPWAHPIWSQYILILFDLTTPVHGKPAKLLRPGVTHEFQLYALDPEHKVRNVIDHTWKLLTPPNHGFQFYAGSNAEAQARLQACVDAVDARRISPDTDYRAQWDALFGDGVSLRIEGCLI